MSMIDTFAATGAGAFSLSENGLYTVEGWKHFLGRLTATGVFTVSRWYGSNNVNETGRMVSLAVRALLDLGVRDPSRQLYLVSARNLATLVVARAPLSQSETDQLSRTAEQLHFRILLAPDRPSESPVLHAIVSAHDPAELETYTSSLVLDLTPPTDNRPFFFNQLPLTRAYWLWIRSSIQHQEYLSGNIIASLTLLLILIVSIILVVTTIILPMRPAIRQSNRRLVLGGSAYFLLVGLGFMFIEIGLLQRLSIFLGHPTYSLSIVLFSIGTVHRNWQSLIGKTAVGDARDVQCVDTAHGGLCAMSAALASRCPTDLRERRNFRPCCCDDCHCGAGRDPDGFWLSDRNGPCDAH